MALRVDHATNAIEHAHPHPPAGAARADCNLRCKDCGNLHRVSWLYVEDDLADMLDEGNLCCDDCGSHDLEWEQKK